MEIPDEITQLLDWLEALPLIGQIGVAIGASLVFLAIIMTSFASFNTDKLLLSWEISSLTLIYFYQVLERVKLSALSVL